MSLYFIFFTLCSNSLKQQVIWEEGVCMSHLVVLKEEDILDKMFESAASVFVHPGSFILTVSDQWAIMWKYGKRKPAAGSGLQPAIVSQQQLKGSLLIRFKTLIIWFECVGKCWLNS